MKRPFIEKAGPPVALLALAIALSAWLSRNYPPSSVLNALLRMMKGTEELISHIVSSLGWAGIALIAVLVLRRQLIEVLHAVAEAIPGRGFSVDVGATLKLQLTEPPAGAFEEPHPLLSPSPFEISDGSHEASESPLEQIRAQSLFQVSDAVATFHEKDDNGERKTRMERARLALKEACNQPAPDRVLVRKQLIAFARALEESMFLDADELVELLSACAVLQIVVRELKPVKGHHDDWIAVNAVGVAYAQSENWPKASETLTAIAVNTDGTPNYEPAGATWLACEYNKLVTAMQSEDPELAAAYFSKVDELAAMGARFEQAIDKADWSAVGAVASKGYYRREVLKDLGNILSIAAASSADRARRNLLLNRAKGYLEKCIEDVNDEPATAIDHNNLADFYRQLAEEADSPEQAAGHYEAAHKEITKAIDGSRPDPAFVDTQALIFLSQKKPLDALRALEGYRESDAEPPKVAAGDKRQHIRNEILSAKIAFALGTTRMPPDLARIVATLEHAQAFVERQRTSLTPKSADELSSEILELLGVAHLRWESHAAQATEAFERLSKLKAYVPPLPVLLRSRVAAATARTRLARQLRHEFSRADAARRRDEAALDLKAVDGEIDKLAIDAAQPNARRQRDFRLRLDAAGARQSLAEERFAADETNQAKELSAKVTRLLSFLRQAQLDGALTGSDRRETLARMEQTRARRTLLDSLIAIRLDPTIADADLPHKVTVDLKEARGVNGELDCRIDLTLGGLLLAAAQTGKGDAQHLYREAVSALERAAGRDVPALRTEALTALSAAYAARGSILRAKKKSAETK